MKTRYSSLVSIKKDVVQKSERVFEQKNSVVQKAKETLENSLRSLQEITPPQTGKISDFLSSRAMLDVQCGVIRHNEEWLRYASQDMQEAKEQLKTDMIEFEKYKYLELQEIEKIKKEQKIKEAKTLDEVALIAFETKRRKDQKGYTL